MAIFDTGVVETTLENTFKNPQEFEQIMIADEIANMSQEELQEFCAPDGLGQHLVTEGKLRNRTLVRLSKKDDLSRRKKMAAYELAKEHNDPAWKKFVMFRQKALEMENKMAAKYGAKAERIAMMSQKSYLRGDKDDSKAGLENKFGAQDR